MTIKRRHIRMARAAFRCLERGGTGGRIIYLGGTFALVPTAIANVEDWHRAANGRKA